ncbi:expressed unknown protein [Seminavis robusta]|uniref:PDZ domain-containing protein n=1 Tax=Seminavis robusta TaxID=568900 RepID=A0A9N8ENR8_9STRA|nr:expressed unknown protein [Seminavis robusta]|eukprot:Sro1333_g263620.1 n/a (237) ;mRNA; r:5121-5831
MTARVHEFNHSLVRPFAEPASKRRIVKACFVKATTKTRCGLSLARRRSGHFVVRKILPDSLAASTPLKPGMLVHTINNKQLTTLSSKEAAKTLVRAEGQVTILATIATGGGANNVATTTKKESEDKRVPRITWKRRPRQKGVFCKRYGARLSEDPSGGYVVISHILHGSPFEHTSLEAGMTILEIDNQSCRGMPPAQIAYKIDSIVVTSSVLIGKKDGTPVVKVVCTRTGHILSYL